VFETAVVGPLLEAIRHRTGASGVYLYRFDENGAAHSAGRSGARPDVDNDELTGTAVLSHARRNSPIVVHDGAWTDWRFAIFPEVAQFHLENLVSIPLLHNDATVGILNIARAEAAPLSGGDFAALTALSLPVGALVAAAAEYKRLSEQLADRRLLDRAKGILQARLAWTEEQAYLHLRRTSRRRRIKMREIAREVIKAGPSLPAEVRRAS
jgi:GAF domain-containing protein